MMLHHDADPNEACRRPRTTPGARARSDRSCEGGVRLAPYLARQAVRATSQSRYSSS